MAGLLFRKKCLEPVRFEGVQRGGSVGEKRGRSCNHVDGPKTEKALKPTVEIKSGTRNLEADSQKQSGEYGRVCKVEDSHIIGTGVSDSRSSVNIMPASLNKKLN